MTQKDPQQQFLSSRLGRRLSSLKQKHPPHQLALGLCQQRCCSLNRSIMAFDEEDNGLGSVIKIGASTQQTLTDQDPFTYSHQFRRGGTHICTRSPLIQKSFEAIKPNPQCLVSILTSSNLENSKLVARRLVIQSLERVCYEFSLKTWALRILYGHDNAGLQASFFFFGRLEAYRMSSGKWEVSQHILLMWVLLPSSLNSSRGHFFL